MSSAGFKRQGLGSKGSAQLKRAFLGARSTTTTTTPVVIQTPVRTTQLRRRTTATRAA